MADQKKQEFRFLATGIGSVPYLDVRKTCQMILDRFPEVPFWPQFPKRSFLEGMIVQFSEGLPLLEPDEQEMGLRVSQKDRPSEFTRFWEHFLVDDTDYFAMSREYAQGLYAMIDLLKERPEGDYVKGQSVGPVTFCTAVRDSEGRAVIHDAEWSEALAKGLAIKALWQIRELSRLGRRPILFIDEPSLSGFGSAFSPVGRDEVIRMLREFMAYLRERCSVILGIHCCGNTDWSMIVESGPDIVNFDAYTYLETFVLYREQISRFLAAGGSVAWGIVPTGDQAGHASAQAMIERIKEGLDRLSGSGKNLHEISRSSLLTPACGMGNMSETDANETMDRLEEVSIKMNIEHRTSNIER